MPTNGYSPLPGTERPTRVRFSILGLLCLLAMITYLDRAMYGSAKGPMMEALGQPEKNFFLVLVFFQVAYALFEIPTGWMGDIFGPRKTLIRIVLWWSLFVALTGCAGTIFPRTEWGVAAFVIFLAMQFCFGMGEAGAFPNISKAIYNWFPENQRGFAKGVTWTAARLMGGLTPFIWALLVTIGGLEWREALWLFAGVAVAWCLVFMWWFRNVPEEHPAANQAEAEVINAGKGRHTGPDGVPWRKIFTNKNVLALCLMYIVTNFNWYFLMYYLPGTLKAQFPDWGKTDGGLLLLALLSGAPLLVGMGGCMLGGLLTDWYISRTGDRKWGRRIFPMIGYGMAGVCYLTAAFFTHDLRVFAGCLILVGFFNDLIMGPSWATAQDIGRRYSATVSGTMNMVGNLGAAVGNLVTGLILAAYTVKVTTDGVEKDVVQNGGYVVCFTMYAIVYGHGVLSWLLIDTTKPIIPEDVAPPADPPVEDPW
ncbi:MAG: transporter [Gemmataceae bacterium]|nr:transporter [Gemmataceae bacterium]